MRARYPATRVGGVRECRRLHGLGPASSCRVFCHCQRLRRHRSAWLQTKFIIATEKARKVLDAADAKVVDCGLHLLLKLRNGTNRSWDLMSTIADSAAFPHWVEHDQLLMTAYNACRASAVIALQYLGRLWLPASRTRRNECANLSPPPRGSSKTCSLTCISPVIHRKDGDCINGSDPNTGPTAELRFGSRQELPSTVLSGPTSTVNGIGEQERDQVASSTPQACWSGRMCEGEGRYHPRRRQSWY